MGPINPPKPVGDGDPCTVDSCDPKVGVKHEKKVGCVGCGSDVGRLGGINEGRVRGGRGDTRTHDANPVALAVSVLSATYERHRGVDRTGGEISHHVSNPSELKSA